MNNSRNFKSGEETSNVSDLSYSPRYPTILDQHGVILLTYGEISLKSERVRKRLEGRLMKDIKFRLTQKNIPFNDIFRDRGRIYISASNKDLKQIVNIIPKCIGVYTYSPALVCSAEPQIIYDSVMDYAKSVLKKDFTFGFRTRVVGNKEFHSQALAAKLGELILDEFKPKLNVSVNLTNPNAWFYVEVRNDKVYLYHEKIKTPWIGNPIELPSGVLGIISNNISDYVSSFLAAKRGFFLLPVIYTMDESMDFSKTPLKITEYSDKKKVLRSFIDYFPIKTLYGLKIDLWRVFKSSEEFIKNTKINIKNINGIDEELIQNLNFPIVQSLKLRIAEWILGNYEPIFLELEKRSSINLEAISNILRPLSKKRADRRNLIPGREFIKFSAITDGDYMETWRSYPNILMKDVLFPIVESSERLIYRAAFPFNDTEIEELFIKIDPVLEQYIPQTDKVSNETAEVSPENLIKGNNSVLSPDYDTKLIREKVGVIFNKLMQDILDLNGFNAGVDCLKNNILELVEIKRTQ